MDFHEAERLMHTIENYPLVYIAGPFRANGKDDIRDEDVKKNVAHAMDVARQLWESGIAALCPHANTSMEFTEGRTDPQMFLDADIKMMMACDAVLMLDNWQSSEGAKREHEIAEKLGMPIYEPGQMDKAMGVDGVRLFARYMVAYPKQFLGMRILHAMMYHLHIAKNRDYSPRNILGTGMVGLSTRLWDKSARFMNLIGFNIDTGDYSAEKEPKNESILDTLMDMACYALIAVLYRFRVWAK